MRQNGNTVFEIVTKCLILQVFFSFSTKIPEPFSFMVEWFATMKIIDLELT